MNTQHWLEDFKRRMQHIDDDIVSSMLTQTVAEYVRMTSMSPDMSDWFMNYSAKNVDHLSTLATALEVRIRSHQAAGEMMLTPPLMILMFTCKGIIDPTITADVVKLWDTLKSRGRKNLNKTAQMMDDSIWNEVTTIAKTFEPLALYHQSYSNSQPSNHTNAFVASNNSQPATPDTANAQSPLSNLSLFLLASMGVLLVGLAPMPYAFYSLVRLTVCLTAALVAFNDYNSGHQKWVVFAGIAVLFNPLLPIYLNRSIWIVIDLATIGLFFWRNQQEYK
ncbi:hypothetical protein OAE29_06945 [Octadecabacter sp.]|nr:hypothetical protein [Octadecabacter sp.]